MFGEMNWIDRAIINTMKIASVLVLLWLMFAVGAGITKAFAHDDDASHDDWYMSLKQPDNPTASCCGIADAYWCDDIDTTDNLSSANNFIKAGYRLYMPEFPWSFPNALYWRKRV